MKARELVTDGGMTMLREIPFKATSPNAPLGNRYFDQFRTYAPGEWFGSRRLKLDEISLYRKKYGEKDEGLIS